MKFSGALGSLNSQPGQMALGYDPQDEVIVLWVKNSHPDNNSVEMEFGLDESGTPVILRKGVLTNLPRAFALAARAEGAVLHVIGSLNG